MFTEDSINNSISHAIFNGSYAYPSSTGLDPLEGPVLQGNGSNSNSAINPNDSSNNEYSFLLDQPQAQTQPQARQKRGREWSAEEIQGHYLDEVEEYQWSQTMAIRALLQQQTQQEQLQMRFDQQLGPTKGQGLRFFNNNLNNISNIRTGRTLRIPRAHKEYSSSNTNCRSRDQINP
ncbi:hypothetical protein BGZ82_005659 [Podila clonocystis]|nr:hypothetical protein BGZ82_005659 [Podila clonocystis]